MAKFKRAIVAINRRMNAKFHLVGLEMKEPEKLEFLPGQFLALKVAGGQIRDYSIASSPVDSRKFELLVDVSGQGLGASYLERLRPGEEIEFLAPLGNFVFRGDDPVGELLFVATGSGMAPLRSMINYALRVQNEKRPVFLYWGLRFEEDICLIEEWDQLSAGFPNFRYTICLSKPGEKWEGRRGHVTGNVERDFGDFKDFSAYLCGGRRMIEEMAGILTERGLLRERCYFEKFW